MLARRVIVSLFFVLCPGVMGVYLPGALPIGYQIGDSVEVRVNEMSSSQTQLPMDYRKIHSAKSKCQPATFNSRQDENLGELLTGALTEPTAYILKMGKDITCELVCEDTLDSELKSRLKQFVAEGYTATINVDGLPGAVKYRVGSDGEVVRPAFPIGWGGVSGTHVYNHLTYKIDYHESSGGAFGGGIELRRYVVGVEIEPQSLSGPDCGQSTGASLPLDIDAVSSIRYTYSVKWRLNTEKQWATRWDVYLSLTPGTGDVHWFSIVNSVAIALFLAALVAAILARVLSRDIQQYNALISEGSPAEEFAEETGWKLVHGDVFRAPPYRRWFCVAVASGSQLLLMSSLVILLSAIGFLSPIHRGAVLQGGLILFAISGGLAGYVAAKVLKTFGVHDGMSGSPGTNVPRRTVLLTATAFPGAAFLLFFLLNIFIWAKGSSGAVPFTTMLAVLVLWMGISLPLVLIGASIAARQDPVSLPCRVNAIPRPLPAAHVRPWYMKSYAMYAVGGILPFGAIFTELFFIMGSLWQHQFYYLFGILAVVGVVFLLTCAEVSVALTYFKLSGEDYRWWWGSFLVSGSCGLYVFLYSLIYLSTRLHLANTVSVIVYIGYMALIAIGTALVAGTFGFAATFQFLRLIYGSVKID